MRVALTAAILLMTGSIASAQQQPAVKFEALLQNFAGTTAVSAYPQFSDGKLGSCVFEFSSIVADTAYRQGGFSKVFGSFGLMEANGNVAITLKVVVHDINTKTGEFKPSAPANSYFIFGTQSSKDELVGKYPSDTPGAQFSVFKPLPMYEKVADAMDRGNITIAFNRKNGGMDILVPIDLTVVSTNDSGKRTHSPKMVADFYACTSDLMKSARSSAAK